MLMMGPTGICVLGHTSALGPSELRCSLSALQGHKIGSLGEKAATLPDEVRLRGLVGALVLTKGALPLSKTGSCTCLTVPGLGALKITGAVRRDGRVPVESHLLLHQMRTCPPRK